MRATPARTRPQGPTPALILVRHAAPTVDPARPPATWELSASGTAAAHQLGRRLAPYAPYRVVSSPEPKARATAHCLLAAAGRGFSINDGLREHVRRDAPYLDAVTFAATIARLLTTPDTLVYGEESGAAARARFAAAVAAELDATPADTSLVIVGHGTVISLYLAHIAGIDPVAFWQTLGMPAYAVLARPSLTLLTVVNDVTGAADEPQPPG